VGGVPRSEQVAEPVDQGVLDRLGDGGLDLRSILENLDNEQDLYDQINVAVEQAVKDSLVDRLRDLLP
jgi:hypothetical protein